MTSPAEEGDLTAAICVLAEAPAKTEMRLGRPLVGAAGYVFEECLVAAQLKRHQLYILNVWPFEVRKDHNGVFYAPNGATIWRPGTGFTEAGLEAATPTLSRLRNCSARVILAMGQQAADLAAGITEKIMKWRGSILPGLSRTGGIKVIPTIHPAATLHGTYLWRYNIIADMRRAKEESHSRELNLPQRNLIIQPTFSETMDYLKLCRTKPRVATDLEVINHQVACFSLSHDPSEAMTVPLVHRGGHYFSVDEEVAVWTAYAELMGDPDVAKVNQNLIGFDMVFLFRQMGIYTQGDLCDPMLAQHIVYPDFPKGLDYIASIHTREPYYKDEGKFWRDQGGDWATFWRYCAKDAAVALEAWDVLRQEMLDGGYWHTYCMTTRLAEPLLYLAAQGLPVNQDNLVEAKRRVAADLEAKQEKLKQVAEWPFNPFSPKDCQKYFYKTKRIEPYTGQRGRPTTDDKALARIYRRYNLPEAKLVQEIRALHKLKATYIEVMLDPDGRLRCSWNSRGTWTGRLSSSQTIFGTGLNLQNLHPAFKSFIVAETCSHE